MKISEDFKARLPFDGDVLTTLKKIVAAYGFREINNSRVVTSGFEDCNFIVSTDKGKIFVKVYSRIRTPEDIKRNVSILEAVSKSGIHHPRLYLTNMHEILFSDGKVQAVVMDYINGQSFHDLDRQPTDKELELIIGEAVKITELDIKPPFIYDSIAIVNLLDMFERVTPYLSAEDADLLKPVVEKFKAIDFSGLPKKFIHGDLISTNLILDNCGRVWVIDFSVGNVYPAVQEIAVIASSLLYGDGLSLKTRIEKLVSLYRNMGGSLNEHEKKALYPMALAAQAMELMGGYQYVYINKDNIKEAQHWMKVGREGLKKEQAVMKGVK